MRMSRYVITGGHVELSDEDDGTTRRTWRAEVWIGRSRNGEPPFPEAGHGSGKAPHVALNRAVSDALTKAKQAR